MLMKNNIKTVLPTFVIAILLVLLGYYCGKTKQNVLKQDTIINTRIDTVWKDTTIVEKEFVPNEIIKKKVDTLYLSNGDTMQLITESKTFEKRLTIDKDTADVEIYTTGIETSLDSLKMRLRTHKEVVTNTITVEKYIEKPKKFKDRFHIQPQIGVGYGIFHKSIDLYAGVGVRFDI